MSSEVKLKRYKILRRLTTSSWQNYPKLSLDIFAIERFNAIILLFIGAWSKLKYDRIQPMIRKRRKKMLLSNHLRVMNEVKNKDFSIISSNCWGGSVYEDLGLKYQTPTVGLFFFAPCFVEFAGDLQGYLQKELVFVEISKYASANEFIKKIHKYPIGLLNNTVEIHFLHYSSLQEAKEKWERRKQRVNYDNLFFSLTDQDDITYQLMQDYDKLLIPNKVLFASQKYREIKCCIQIKTYRHYLQIGDIYNNREEVTKHFRVDKWLNSML